MAQGGRGGAEELNNHLDRHVCVEVVVVVVVVVVAVAIVVVHVCAYSYISPPAVAPVTLRISPALSGPVRWIPRKGMVWFNSRALTHRPRANAAAPELPPALRLSAAVPFSWPMRVRRASSLLLFSIDTNVQN